MSRLCRLSLSLCQMMGHMAPQLWPRSTSWVTYVTACAIGFSPWNSKQMAAPWPWCFGPALQHWSNRPRWRSYETRRTSQCPGRRGAQDLVAHMHSRKWREPCSLSQLHKEPNPNPFGSPPPPKKKTNPNLNPNPNPPSPPEAPNPNPNPNPLVWG